MAHICVIDPANICNTERSFLMSDYVFDELSNASLWTRWRLVLDWIPEMRRLHLWDAEVDTVLGTVYRAGSGHRLFSALELSILKVQFYTMLRDYNIGRAHINEFEATAAAVWRDKLYDRWVETNGARFKRTHGSRGTAVFYRRGRRGENRKTPLATVTLTDAGPYKLGSYAPKEAARFLLGFKNFYVHRPMWPSGLSEPRCWMFSHEGAVISWTKMDSTRQDAVVQFVRNAKQMGGDFWANLAQVVANNRGKIR